MSVNAAFEGRVYPPQPPYAVGRESVREFALAVGAGSPLHHAVEAARAAGHRDVVAPPTYGVVIAQRCEAQYVADPEAGIDFARVVHAEEHFEYRRPIVAGQEVVATLTVERIRQVGGHAMVTTRVELTEGPQRPDDGHRLGWVSSTLVVRGEEA